MVGNARHSGRDKSLYVTYRCPSKHYSCSNKEINRDYLERFVVDLLEERIFNNTALKQITENIERHSADGAVRG